MQVDKSRRQLLQFGAAALASIPVIAFAKKNEGLRASFKYVDKTPEPGKTCDNCVQWVPGPDAKALGGCKIFMGDTEVHPNGWCNVWAKK